jgi:hypothetical protein
MYFFALSMYNAPSYFLAGFGNSIRLERVMIIRLIEAVVYLVLMLIGTGFVYTRSMIGSSRHLGLHVRPQSSQTAFAAVTLRRHCA